MKLTGRFYRLAFCSAVATVVALASNAWAAEGSATITKVSGTAETSANGTTWTAAAVGKMLAPGTSIRSSGTTGSQIDTYLGSNGGSVQLAPSTEVKFEKLTTQSGGLGPVADTALNLKAGTIVGAIKSALPAGSKYEVKTPSSVIAINVTRGPVRYQISASGAVHIVEGQVVVAAGAAAGVTVNAGQSFTPGAGGGSVGVTPPGSLINLPPPVEPQPPVLPSLPTAPTVEFISPVPEVSGTTGV